MGIYVAADGSIQMTPEAPAQPQTSPAGGWQNVPPTPAPSYDPSAPPQQGTNPWGTGPVMPPAYPSPTYGTAPGIRASTPQTYIAADGSIQIRPQTQEATRPWWDDVMDTPNIPPGYVPSNAVASKGYNPDGSGWVNQSEIQAGQGDQSGLAGLKAKFDQLVNSGDLAGAKAFSQFLGQSPEQYQNQLNTVAGGGTGGKSSTFVDPGRSALPGANANSGILSKYSQPAIDEAIAYIKANGQRDPQGTAQLAASKGINAAELAELTNRALGTNYTAENAQALMTQAQNPTIPPANGNTILGSGGLPTTLDDFRRMMTGAGITEASQPYQPYTGQRIQGLDPLSEQASTLAQGNVGSWKSGLDYAGKTAPSLVNDYMDPYQDQVTDRIAQLGQRNLTEKLLPQVNSTFTGAGQFGSTRNSDFNNRALRDTNESIMGAQGQYLSQGYQQSMDNINTDQTRMASVAGQGAQLGAADAASLNALGQTNQQLGQSNLDLNYQNFNEQNNYQKNQMDWLNQLVKGTPSMSGSTSSPTIPGYQAAPTPQQTGNPLLQAAGAYGTLQSLAPALSKAFAGPGQ